MKLLDEKKIKVWESYTVVRLSIKFIINWIWICKIKYDSIKNKPATFVGLTNIDQIIKTNVNTKMIYAIQKSSIKHMDFTSDQWNLYQYTFKYSANITSDCPGP